MVRAQLDQTIPALQCLRTFFRRKLVVRATVSLVAISPLLVVMGVGFQRATSDKAARPGALLVNEANAFQGFTLLATINSTKTYLIDMEGKVVRSWESGCGPAMSAYLLENGHLLRTGTLDEPTQAPGSGAGGRVQEFTWEGKLVWDFKFFNKKQQAHHDIARLPNGNVLLIVWDKKSAEEAIAAGRRPDFVHTQLLADSLIEVRPTGKTTGEVVWEWHSWDHLVQDFDASKPNYGCVADHPELVNLNYGEDALEPFLVNRDSADKLRSIGYIGSQTASPKAPHFSPDWTHCNAVAYNAALDQIMLSIHVFNEIWIIDHGTSTAEAASHAGGRCGKGGDLLYRWGNPAAYRAGTAADQRLFGQHNAHWIPPGLPGAGHLLVFNNGPGRPDGSYSSVDEIVLPVDAKGQYARQPGAAFGPEYPIWSYVAPDVSDFCSIAFSGAQRLANGDTLICAGFDGTIFEVDPEDQVVWKYVNPVKAFNPLTAHGGFGSGSRGQRASSPFGQAPMGPPGFAPPAGSPLFHANRYPSDYAGLKDKDLTPGKTIEELQPKRPNGT
jgi:hypothetical protein